MPIYEYQCQKCHKKHEFWQKITEGPIKKCPACKGPLERLISGTGFVLKGSGWYKSDYERKGKPGGSDQKSEEASSGASESSDSKDSDSKSESKADEKKPNTYGANDAPEKKPEPKPEKSEKPGAKPKKKKRG